MSDEVGAIKKPESGPFVHLCEHSGCKKWGGFGFAHGRAAPNWYCYEHRPPVWPPARKS
ncbi:hypothetical protein J2Z19_003280 [Ensifer adhaerens]|uniref:Uncharacterized protein n=1 Tax=Ensifer adhaerens TaxID=106592 RepID=A0ACC5SXM5_ENSAD|nr:MULTISPECIES: hypothetical protein [Sinorhizobium/Ensifer group]MBP1873565.1 hypothetical protein [Ensifer adhaerens]